MNNTEATEVASDTIEWMIAWEEAAKLGYVDGLFGSECRRGLEAFLSLEPVRRGEWIRRSFEWQQRNLVNPGAGLDISDPLEEGRS